MKTLSHMYRRAWRTGLKTTYYLRTLGASNIEKATLNLKKEVRGMVGGEPAKPEFTAEEKQACSLAARARGEECEACQ
jgi:ribonucleoside-diphosphate reductase alpha chain